MGMRTTLACVSLLSLMGCETFAFSPITEGKSVTVAVSNLIDLQGATSNGNERTKSIEGQPSTLFEKETLFPVTREASLALVVLEEEPLTLEVVQAFFEEKVMGSSAVGLLLQSNDLVLAFMPNSPVFHVWRLSGELTQLESLLGRIGIDYPFIPNLMTTELFEEAFHATPSLKATFLGSTLLEGPHFQFIKYNRHKNFDVTALKKALDETLFGRQVEIEMKKDTLALKIFLNDSNDRQEEWIRHLSSRVLKDLRQQKGVHAFHSFTVDYLAKSPQSVSGVENSAKSSREEPSDELILASIELSVHELFSLPWDGQLNQTLAEPLPYFRYYGTIEYE